MNWPCAASGRIFSSSGTSVALQALRKAANQLLGFLGIIEFPGLRKLLDAIALLRGGDEHNHLCT